MSPCSLALVTISVQCVCACIMHACVHASRFVQPITSTLMPGFQNNLAHFFSLMSRSAIWNICLGRLKVKVTLEGQKMVIN